MRFRPVTPWIPLAACAAALCLSVGARADIFVDAAAACSPCDGTALAPFPAIQDGIDAAAPGETVRVFPGTYVENLRIDGKVVHLVAAGGPGQTVIDGGDLDTTLTLDDAGISSVTGFRITGGRSAFGGGIEILGGAGLLGEPTISRNVITGNEAIEVAPGFDGDGGGICISNAPGAVVIGNLIRDNLAVRLGGGLALVGSDDATVAYNTIVGNLLTGVASGFGPAIGVVYGDGQAIANNVIAGNASASASTGALDVYYATASIAGNLFDQNLPVDFVSTSGALPPGNPHADPRFLDAPAGNYHLMLPSPAVEGADPLVTAPPVDLDGNPRPIDAEGDSMAVADAGCYEHLGQVSELSVAGTGTVAWTAADVLPDAYHVYRSTPAGLRGGDLGSCQDARDPDLDDLAFEEFDDPPQRQIFTFVVSFSRAGAAASLGLSSAGSDRIPLTPCP